MSRNNTGKSGQRQRQDPHEGKSCSVENLDHRSLRNLCGRYESDPLSPRRTLMRSSATSLRSVPRRGGNAREAAPLTPDDTNVSSSTVQPSEGPTRRPSDPRRGWVGSQHQYNLPNLWFDFNPNIGLAIFHRLGISTEPKILKRHFTPANRRMPIPPGAG